MVVVLGLAISTALAALSFYTVERWAMRYRDGQGGRSVGASPRSPSAAARSRQGAGQPVTAAALR